MASTNPKAEAYFANLSDWREELYALREVLLSTALVEDYKWSSPVYTHRGANVAIIWGFKDRATLGFFKGTLLKDPEGILLAPGENSRSSRMINFTELAQIRKTEPMLRDYIAEAIINEENGLRVKFAKDDLEYPDELNQRLDGDEAFRVAFEALTPGRRRGWVLHFLGAKQQKTRVSRIEKAAARIFKGKGMHDR